MRKEIDELEDELLAECDFSKMEAGVRGKYVDRYQSGTNLVLLDPYAIQAFPNAASVVVSSCKIK